ncbi:MAG TPA: hypothetical protein VN784_04580 [Candidatus Limnocylindrales bacterium]|nr:hypothetical protein [Candidatus Limnocylindrales bacterium]
MNPTRQVRIIVCLFYFGLASLITGCKTIDSTAVSNFAASVTDVKSQADDALNATAALTRDASVRYAASQPTLAEANFVKTPTDETITEWDGALTTIETYAQNLSTLLSPDAAKDFDVAATNLFNQFNQTAGRLNANRMNSQAGVNALLATAFTQTADAIIQAKEQATAVKIAAATDSQITKILSLLANEIGADRATPGLRRTVYEAVWTPRLANLSASFLTTTNFADKLALSQQYADMLAQRDAQDQLLTGLRQSLLALSDAHHALAQGKPASIPADLAVVAGEIQHTRELYSQFSNTTKQ